MEEKGEVTTLKRSLLGQSLPFGRGARQDHFTGSNFPKNVMVLHLRRDFSSCETAVERRE